MKTFFLIYDWGKCLNNILLLMSAQEEKTIELQLALHAKLRKYELALKI